MCKRDMASKTHVMSPPGEGKSFSMGGLGVIYKVLGEDTGGALAVVEHPIDPGRLHTDTLTRLLSYRHTHARFFTP